MFEDKFRVCIEERCAVVAADVEKEGDRSYRAVNRREPRLKTKNAMHKREALRVGPSRRASVVLETASYADIGRDLALRHGQLSLRRRKTQSKARRRAAEFQRPLSRGSEKSLGEGERGKERDEELHGGDHGSFSPGS